MTRLKPMLDETQWTFLEGLTAEACKHTLTIRLCVRVQDLLRNSPLSSWQISGRALQIATHGTSITADSWKIAKAAYKELFDTSFVVFSTVKCDAESRSLCLTVCQARAVRWVGPNAEAASRVLH